MNFSDMQKGLFEETADKLTINAPAKVNLYLLITGKRDDGYHNIETLMSKITLYDRLDIEPPVAKGIELECKGKYWAPQNADNLIIKAAKALEQACGRDISAKITLTKNIPAGTGLGSASSNAAAAILGLNKFHTLGLSPAELASIASKCGSDTAFFTGSPLAICSGRGEKLTAVREKLDFKALIIIPPITIPTAKVYQNYTHSSQNYAQAKAAVCPLLSEGKLFEAASQGVNMLTESCFKTNTQMSSIHRQLNRHLNGGVTLSGSGSAFYKLLREGEEEFIKEKTSQLKDSLDCKFIFVTNNKW